MTTTKERYDAAVAEYEAAEIEYDASAAALEAAEKRSKAAIARRDAALAQYEATAAAWRRSYSEPVRYRRIEREDPGRQGKLKAQREQFERDAKSGKVVCLTDLLINHGF